MFRKSAVLLLFVAFFGTACGDDDPVAPPEASLVGTWNVMALELVSNTNPNVQVDLIRLGATATLVLQQNNDFAFSLTWANPPGGVWGTDITEDGTWSSTDVLTLTTSPTNTWQFEASLNGDSLILTEADTSYDFDGDGNVEPASFNMDLARD
jgi:hypothetical protein